MHLLFRRRRAHVLLPALLALLASCGGDGGTAPDTLDPPPSSSEAPPPLLSASSIAPLEALYLSGLPTGRTDFLAELSANGASSATEESDVFLPLVREPDGRYRLHVLTHPTAGAAGGVVELRVRGEGFVTRPAHFTLAPLPAAPGTFAALLDSLQARVDLEIQGLGLTRAELLESGRTGTEVEIAGLAIVQTLLDDPSHDFDLRDMVAGSSGLAQLTGGAGIDVDLLDRLAAAGDLEALLGGVVGAQRAAARPAPLRTAAALPGAMAPGIAGPRRAPLGAAPARGPYLRDITTAATLDEAMHLASQAKALLDPNSGPARLLSAYGLALTGVGVATGPVGSAVATALSAVIWLVQLDQSRIAGIYPSHFVDGGLVFEALPTTFLEDEPGPGVYFPIRVTAQSDGWDLDMQLLNLALLAAGSVRSVGNLDRWIFRGQQGGAVDVANNIVGSLAGVATAMTPGGGGVISHPPRLFPNIDVSEDQWVASRLAGNSIELVDPLSYEPVAAGSTILTVETRPARFGGATPALARETITVEAIRVSIEADRTTVVPGEVVQLQIQVENALDSGLEWTLTDGASWLHGPTELGGGVWTAAIQTPADPDLFPVRTTFTSTAEGGARSAPGAPVRSATLVITGGAIMVQPPTAVVSPGGSIPFQAIVLGLDDTRVTWSATGPGGGPVGIGEDGLFVAPQEPGEYLITATSVADPSVKGTAVVTVAGACSWTLEIGPDVWNGVFASHTYAGLVPGAPFNLNFSEGKGNASEPLGTLMASPLDGGPGPGDATGSWSGVNFSFISASTGGVDWYALDDPQTGSSATLVVTSNDGEAMEGEVTGVAFRVAEGPTVVNAPLRLTFRSVNSQGGGSCGP